MNFARFSRIDSQIIFISRSQCFFLQKTIANVFRWHSFYQSWVQDHLKHYDHMNTWCLFQFILLIWGRSFFRSEVQAVNQASSECFGHNTTFFRERTPKSAAWRRGLPRWRKGSHQNYSGRHKAYHCFLLRRCTHRHGTFFHCIATLFHCQH